MGQRSQDTGVWEELQEHVRWELQLKTKENYTVQSAWRLGGTQECLEEWAC